MSQIDLQWFAAEDEGKTEDPSEYKLNKAREEGRVAKSQELNGSLVFLLCAMLLLVLAPWLERRFEEMLSFYLKISTTSRADNGQLFLIFIRYFLSMVLPFSAVGIIAGVAANLVQNRGFIFSTKPIEPKFEKIVPKFGQYFKRTLFSFEGVFNVLKSIVKVAVIALIAFMMIRGDMENILSSLRAAGPMAAFRHFAGVAAKILIVSALFLLAVGVADYVVQRRQFKEQMKMTKQEVKEEYKDMEGDPQVKSHLEAAQREMLMQNIPKAVKEADVVIANPTHFAVAVEWKRGKTDAPEVTAKGEDLVAQNIKKIARDNNVPVVENRPLARALYSQVEVGQMIPETFLRAVAEIYTQIGWIDKNM